MVVSQELAIFRNCDLTSVKGVKSLTWIIKYIFKMFNLKI